jgi:hypothetical protein
VLGAAGSVGSMVTQLARELGAYVIGTGRAADRQKAARLRRAGVRRPRQRHPRRRRRRRPGIRCHRWGRPEAVRKPDPGRRDAGDRTEGHPRRSPPTAWQATKRRSSTFVHKDSGRHRLPTIPRGALRAPRICPGLSGRRTRGPIRPEALHDGAACTNQRPPRPHRRGSCLLLLEVHGAPKQQQVAERSVGDGGEAEAGWPRRRPGLGSTAAVGATPGRFCLGSHRPRRVRKVEGGARRGLGDLAGSSNQPSRRADAVSAAAPVVPAGARLRSIPPPGRRTRSCPLM